MLPKIKSPLSAIVLFFFFAFGADAQPLNDDCSDAILLSIKSTCSYTQYSNLNATNSGLATPKCGAPANTDVWFKFVVPRSGNIYINTERVNFYAAMALYTGSCDTLTPYICDDNSSQGYLMPFIEFHDTSVAGDTMFLQFWGNNSTDGDFKLCIYEPDQPSNYDCSKSIGLTVQNSCNVKYYTNEHAGNTGIGSPSCDAYIYDDVWFHATVPSSGRLIVRTKNNGIWDPVMSVYRGDCDSLKYITCDDNGGPDYVQSQFYFNDTSLANVKLKFRLWKKNSKFGGGFGICAFEPQVDSNDAIEGATMLKVENNCNYQRFSNIDYTNSGKVTPSCAGYDGGDIWFKTIVPGSGKLVLSTRNVTISNAAMAIYTGNPDTLTEYECNNDIGPYYAQPEIVIDDTALANDTIYIMIWRVSSRFGGVFELCCFEPEIPEYKKCESARLLEVKPSCNFLSFTNQYAGNSGDGLPSCAAYSGTDVWFRFEVPQSGEFTVDSRQGTNQNYGMSLYTGSCGNLTEYTCDDNSSTYSSNMPRIAVKDTSLRGQMVYVQVWRRQNTNGLPFDICVYGKLTPEIRNPKGGTICEGDNIPTLSVRKGVFQYNWYDASTGGNQIASDTHRYTPTSAGTYYVEAVNTETQERSARTAIKLTINPKPKLVNAFDVRHCSNDSLVPLRVNDLQDKYNWYSDSLLEYGVALDTNQYQPAKPGIFYIEAINRYTGCSRSVSLKYTVLSPPEVIGQLDKTGCPNALPVKLQLTDQNAVYRWYSDSGLNTLIASGTEFDVNNTIKVYIQATDSNGCHSKIRSGSVKIENSPLISGLTDIEVCETEIPVSMTVQDLGYRYLWYSDSMRQSLIQYGGTEILRNKSGVVFVEAVDSVTGCASKIISADLTVNRSPKVVGATGFISCDTVGYNGLRVTDLGDTYNWYDAPEGGRLIASDTDGNFPNENGIYYVEAIDPVSGCTSERDSAKLLIYPDVDPVVAYDGDSLHTINAVSYQWYKNGIAIHLATQQSYPVTESGKYSVVITDTNGCEHRSEEVDVEIKAGLVEGINIHLIRIFPNPTKDGTTVRVNNELIGAQVVVIDQNGRVIRENTMKRSELYIDLSDYPSGIYFIQLNSNGRSVTKKVVRY